MRVHLGSDHAGLELKQHLVGWLQDNGHEPSTTARTSTTPLDDYPPYCLRAGEAVVADPGSLGIVIGGSGNGEQIAANKVDGVRAALAWTEETAELGRLHNNANVVAVGAPDAHRRRGHPVRRGLPGHRLHRRGAARPPDRHAHRLRGHRRPAGGTGCRPGAVRRRGLGAGCPKDTPSSAWRETSARRSPASPSRSASPQGRFIEEASIARRPRARDRGVGRQAPLRDLRPRPDAADDPAALSIVHSPPRAHRRLLDRGGPPPEPVGAVRLRIVGRHGVRRPARCDHVRAHLRATDGADPAASSAPTRLRAGRRSRQGLRPDPQEPQADRRAARRPVGARRGRQRLPRRVAVPGAAQPPHDRE